ncbi:glycerophosphodiester phosphodiesterase family protein [Hyphococcus luteus]|nr:glycerophosphodiester phosphodiesterase family protein [Marinicaulis flavus]
MKELGNKGRSRRRCAGIAAALYIGTCGFPAAAQMIPGNCGATNMPPESIVNAFRNREVYPSFTMICAHRGFWSMAHLPQNSQLAFQEAIDWGLDCVENDIRKTADGQYVIFHDAKMDVMFAKDLSNTPLPSNTQINQYTLSQLKSFFLRDRLLNVTHEKIQTLDEHLDQIKDRIVGDHEFKDQDLMANKEAFKYLIGLLQSKGMLSQSVIKGKLTADDYAWVLNELGLDGSEVTYTPKFFNDPKNTVPYLTSEIDKFRSLGVKAYELVITSDDPQNDNLRAIIPDLDLHHDRYGQFDLFPESGRGRYKAMGDRNEWDGSTPDPLKEKRGDWDWIFGTQDYTFMISDRPCLLAQYLSVMGKRYPFDNQ